MSGQPSKYKSEFCEMLIEHMSKGLSFETFANVVCVSPDNVRSWRKTQPEFKDAYKIGCAKRLELYEKIGLQLATGKIKGNSSVWIFAMKAFFKYRDNDPVNNVTNVQVNYDSLPEEQKLKVLQEALKQLEQKELAE